MVVCSNSELDSPGIVVKYYCYHYYCYQGREMLRILQVQRKKL